MNISNGDNMKITTAFKKMFRNGIVDVETGNMVNASHTCLLHTEDKDLLSDLLSDEDVNVRAEKKVLPGNLLSPVGKVSIIDIDYLADAVNCLRALKVEEVMVIMNEKNSFPFSLVSIDGQHLFVIAPRISDDFDKITSARKYSADYEG